MFIKNPNLPNKKIKAVLIDYRADRAEEELKKLGIKVFKTPPLNIAYPTISGHADIVFHQLNQNKAVVAPEAYLYFNKLFSDIEIIKGSSKVLNTYPFDIAYNVARVGEVAFHNNKYTDKKISEYFFENGVKLITVHQGYSKCSISIVSKNAIITSDENISNNAKNNNIDVLLISVGSVKLKDFPYGFIGGASGLISNDTLVFNGSVENHPDYSNIKSFCKNHNVEIYSLHNGELEDIGSIIPLY